LRVPEDRKNVFIVLTGGAAEICVELLWAKVGVRECERDVGLLGSFACAIPGAADFAALA